MTTTSLNDYAAIAAQVIGKLDVIAPNSEPNPWFCKNIFRKRELQ